ncbi:MAG: restriction endonuclease subunit S [Syntrophobacterales bacterium]|nr:restriction endonuclease subunit S [Syntrophobacterales bacterium]
MKLETFFEKFEQFAEAPNAVAKMRELVLQLAVQGKLVEQSPNDGSATDLIERSINERNRLVKEKRIRNSQSITPVSEFKTAGSLPKSWAWTTLAEISLINPRNDVEDDALATFIPMPGIPQNYRGPLDGEIRRWGEIKKSFTHFADGDIALAKITPCFQNGKSAVFRGLKNGIGAGTTELHVARPVGGPVLPEYVWIFLKSPLFIAEGIPAMTGSAGQKRVPTGYFALKPFPLPPLAEQKRIVAKVDELMALCDRLETQQQERETRHAALARASLARFADAPTPENLNSLFHPSYAIAPADLRKTILTLAVQGKLVPPILDENTSYDAWSSNNTITKKVMSIPALPNGWSSAPLVSITAEIVDCPHSTPKWTEYGKICIRTTQFRPGRLDLSTPRYVSEETYTERIQRLRPQEDYILYSREGGILGVACRVPPNVELCLGQRMMLIRSGEKMIPPFLELILNSPFITDIARRETTGGAAPRVNVATVKAYPIPIPPLAEQHQIVAKVDQLMALVDQLEMQLMASRTAAVNLMEAVVAELTVQN